MFNAQFIYIEKGVLDIMVCSGGFCCFISMGTWLTGDQGRLLSRATPGRRVRYLGLSRLLDRKCKNAVQVKGLKLLTSALLGVDAGGCHANSCLVRHFLLPNDYVYYLLHIKKNCSLL